MRGSILVSLQIRQYMFMLWTGNQTSLLSYLYLQDSLIGFEALSRYALNEKNRFIYTMEITIESTFVPGWNYTVRYDPSSWMKIHYIEIPDARGQVKARAKGTGYAVMMVSIYNCMHIIFFFFHSVTFETGLLHVICPRSIGVKFGF